MRKDDFILRFMDDKSIRVEITDSGTTMTKVVSVDTLIDCIKGSIQGARFCSGLLPAGTLSYTKNTENDTTYLVMEFPEQTADITYMNTLYSDFPLPRLLFGFKVEGSGRISGVSLGVPALGKLTPETPMFYYPFSNVNRFQLCTGSNTMPHIKTLQSLQNFPQHILSFPDNDDHYSEKHNRASLGHRDLLEHLADKDRQYYYDSVLVPMPGVTLKQFIQ